MKKENKINNEKNNKRKKKGFTLVELIVVITILTILGTIALISFQGYSKNARDGVRIADLNNVEKSLELFIIEKGFYPTPDGSIQITYSGSIAWMQGTLGDTVVTNIQKLSEKPVDPLTGNEYTYSVTNLKGEYQLGAILEGGSLLSESPMINKTYAAEQKATALVTGTYNEKILKVSTGTTDYILAVPSIINSSLYDTDLIDIVSKKQLVYNNYTNLPDSYKNTGYSMTGGFDFVPSKDIVVYSGSTQDLTQDSNKLIFIDNLKSVYQNTIIQTESIYSDLINSDASLNQTGAIALVDNYVASNIGGIGGGVTTQVPNSVITYSCLAPEPSGVGIASTAVGTPTEVDQAWQSVDSNTACYYSCNANYSGTNCETYTEPFVCGTSTVSAGGFTYTTKVGLDGKCWTNTNMKHGTQLANGTTVPSDDNVIEKWCYSNNSANCNSLGALYTWAEAMGFPASCNTTNCTQSEDTTKSTCGQLGAGWHLPSDAELYSLENASKSVGQSCGSTRTGWDCSGAGFEGNRLNGIGYYAAGARATNGSYSDIGAGVFLWSSTNYSASYSWSRYQISGFATVNRSNTFAKAYGFSVTCVKD